MSEGVNIYEDKRLKQFNDDRSVGVQQYSSFASRSNLPIAVTGGTNHSACWRETEKTVCVCIAAPFGYYINTEKELL